MPLILKFLIIVSIVSIIVGLCVWLIVYMIKVHDEWSDHHSTYLIVMKQNKTFYLKRRFLFYFWRKYKTVDRSTGKPKKVIEYFLSFDDARTYARKLPTYFRKEERDSIEGRV